jgi:hypothetical protein
VHLAAHDGLGHVTGSFIQQTFGLQGKVFLLREQEPSASLLFQPPVLHEQSSLHDTLVELIRRRVSGGTHNSMFAACCLLCTSVGW